jgi:hypothetical protein
LSQPSNPPLHQVYLNNFHQKLFKEEAKPPRDMLPFALRAFVAQTGGNADHFAMCLTAIVHDARQAGISNGDGLCHGFVLRYTYPFNHDVDENPRR